MNTIIFVCHGNICRSPAAEYICKDILRKRGMEKDFCILSRAVSYEEIGNDIYPPMKYELDKNNIPYSRHRASIITKDDYEKADYIFIMDQSNLRRISYILDDYKNIIKPIFCYTDGINEIEDPWYTGNYALVVRQIIKCINDILDNLGK